MFQITNLLVKIPNFITFEECDSLIDEFKQAEKDNKSSNILKEASTNVTNDEYKTTPFDVYPIPSTSPNFKFIKEKLKIGVNSYIEYLSQPGYFSSSLLKNQLKYSHSYRIMRYKEGDYIHPHVDKGPNIFGSMTINLNEDYKGGIFKFFNGNHQISLNKGDAIIFPADAFWVHEVTKVTKGVRWSLNSFLCQFPFDVMKENNKHIISIYEDYIDSVPPKELLGPYT